MGHSHDHDHAGAGPDRPRSRRAPTRLLAAAVLAVWAGLFWHLLTSGDWSLFLAERVRWLVPVAAVAFTAGAAGLLLAPATAAPRSLTARERWGAAVLLAPVLLVAIVPLGTLSSYAAQRRTSFAAAQFRGSAPQDGRPLTFQQLVGASASDDGRRALARRDGERVSLVGLVTDPAGARFRLTRFVVACCVVDATVVRVPVVATAPVTVAEGGWVHVDGLLRSDDGGAALTAATVTPADPPDPPYLYP